MPELAIPEVADGDVAPSVRTLQSLMSARVAKLTQLVLPPGHEPILDVMATIWLDGIEVGFQMAEQNRVVTLSGAVVESVYEQCESAELCSEYDEFPELDDRDFQDIACQRVDKISKGIHPIGHPDVIWDKVEIWTDGVATALRIVRDEGPAQA